MERLTMRSPIDNGVLVKNKSGYTSLCFGCEEIGDCEGKQCPEAKVVEKLAEYEDLEEQGLLLRFPCKVGDTIYELCKCDDDTHKIFPMVVKDISPYGTLRQCKSGDCVWNIYAESDYTYTYKSFYDLGKSVFLTKSEAEQALEKLESEGENETY